MPRKAAWFFGIFFAVFTLTSVLLAAIEPGNTDPGELGRAVGRLIIPMLLVTTALYFGAKRLGWILKGSARRG